VSSADGQVEYPILPAPSDDSVLVVPHVQAVVPTPIAPTRAADPRIAKLADKYGKLEQKVVGLVGERQHASDDSERRRIRDQITEVTAEQFDLRHQMRKLEIERIEKHLRDVETKIDRREKLKQEIIDKRVADLLDDDEKLRWDPVPTTGAAPQISTITMTGEEVLPDGTRMRVPRALAIPRAWPAARTGFIRRRLVKEKAITPQGVMETTRTVVTAVADPSSKYHLEPGVLMSGPDTKDSDIAQLKGIKDLRRLDLSHTLITDTGLQQLEQFQTLEALSLVETQITDVGLESIGKLKQLKHLDLARTGITDEGLRHLHKLGMLQSIVLDGTKITADGIGQLLAKIPIHHLSFDNTRVDDSLADQLTDADSLQTLSAINTAMTTSGLEALQRALPNCAFRSMPPAIGTCERVTTPHVSQPIRHLPPSERVTPAAIEPGPAAATTAEPLVMAGGLSVAEAKARLDIAKRNLERVQTLAKQNVVAQSELDEAQNATQLAELAFERVSREHDALRKLLELGVRQAELALERAKVELDESHLINRKTPGAITPAQIRNASSTVEEKKLALERAQTLLELHVQGADESPASKPTTKQPKQDKSTR